MKITLRCAGRKLLMATGNQPELIREIFGYLLGRAADKYGVRVHACTQLSDHMHLDITDVRGVLPSFKGFLHSLIARAINQVRGRGGDFWERAGSCDTVRDNDEQAIRDLVYTDTNAVKHGLVKWPELWPGFTTAGWAFGETRVFARPKIALFDVESGHWPDQVSLTRAKPPCLSGHTDAEATQLLRDRVRMYALAKQAEMKQQKRRFKQPLKLAKVKWWKSAISDEKRFAVAPKVASSCRWRRLEMLQRDREWERQYAEAYEELQQGNRAAVFPHGTWLMRVRSKVNVAAPR